jgi:hypothetical protein
MSRDMTTLSRLPRATLAILLLAAGASGCAESNPAALIPPGERVLIQQEAARERGGTPVSVDQVLARARGEVPPQPILVHVADRQGAMSIPDDDVKLLASLDPTRRSAVLSIGPSDEPSPVAAALGATRRARFVARYLPYTLHVAETRYDVNLAPNTARIEFGEADRAH